MKRFKSLVKTIIKKDNNRKEEFTTRTYPPLSNETLGGIRKAIRFIESYDTIPRGIYKQPGFVEEISIVEGLIINGNISESFLENIGSTHSIANGIVNVLSSHAPMIPCELYDHFMSPIANIELLLESFRHKNNDFFDFLMNHLCKMVTTKSTKLSLDDISTYVGVQILRNTDNNEITGNMAESYEEPARIQAFKTILKYYLNPELSRQTSTPDFLSRNERASSVIESTADLEDVKGTIQDRSVKITFLNPSERPDDEEIRKRLNQFGNVVNLGFKDKLAVVLFEKVSSAVKLVLNDDGKGIGPEFKLKYMGNKSFLQVGSSSRSTTPQNLATLSKEHSLELSKENSGKVSPGHKNGSPRTQIIVGSLVQQGSLLSPVIEKPLSWDDKSSSTVLEEESEKYYKPRVSPHNNNENKPDINQPTEVMSFVNSTHDSSLNQTNSSSSQNPSHLDQNPKDLSIHTQNIPLTQLEMVSMSNISLAEHSMEHSPEKESSVERAIGPEKSPRWTTQKVQNFTSDSSDGEPIPLPGRNRGLSVNSVSFSPSGPHPGIAELHIDTTPVSQSWKTATPSKSSQINVSPYESREMPKEQSAEDYSDSRNESRHKKETSSIDESRHIGRINDGDTTSTTGSDVSGQKSRDIMSRSARKKGQNSRINEESGHFSADKMSKSERSHSYQGERELSAENSPRSVQRSIRTIQVGVSPTTSNNSPFSPKNNENSPLSQVFNQYGNENEAFITEEIYPQKESPDHNNIENKIIHKSLEKTAEKRERKTTKEGEIRNSTGKRSRRYSSPDLKTSSTSTSRLDPEERGEKSSTRSREKRSNAVGFERNRRSESRVKSERRSRRHSSPVNYSKSRARSIEKREKESRKPYENLTEYSSDHTEPEKSPKQENHENNEKIKIEDNSDLSDMGSMANHTHSFRDLNEEDWEVNLVEEPVMSDVAKRLHESKQEFKKVAREFALKHNVDYNSGTEYDIPGHQEHKLSTSEVKFNVHLPLVINEKVEKSPNVVILQLEAKLRLLEKENMSLKVKNKNNEDFWSSEIIALKRQIESLQNENTNLSDMLRKLKIELINQNVTINSKQTSKGTLDIIEKNARELARRESLRTVLSQQKLIDLLHKQKDDFSTQINSLQKEVEDLRVSHGQAVADAVHWKFIAFHKDRTQQLIAINSEPAQKIVEEDDLEVSEKSAEVEDNCVEVENTGKQKVTFGSPIEAISEGSVEVEVKAGEHNYQVLMEQSAGNFVEEEIKKPIFNHNEEKNENDLDSYDKVAKLELNRYLSSLPQDEKKPKFQEHLLLLNTENPNQESQSVKIKNKILNNMSKYNNQNNKNDPKPTEMEENENSNQLIETGFNANISNIPMNNEDILHPENPTFQENTENYSYSADLLSKWENQYYNKAKKPINYIPTNLEAKFNSHKMETERGRQLQQKSQKTLGLSPFLPFESLLDTYQIPSSSQINLKTNPYSNQIDQNPIKIPTLASLNSPLFDPSVMDFTRRAGLGNLSLNPTFDRINPKSSSSISDFPYSFDNPMNLNPVNAKSTNLQNWYRSNYI